MNAERRKKISSIMSKIEELVSLVDEIHEEEQDYLDKMPEGLQQGSKGDAAQEAISNLESASESLQNAISELENAAEMHK